MTEDNKKLNEALGTVVAIGFVTCIAPQIGLPIAVACIGHEGLCKFREWRKRMQERKQKRRSEKQAELDRENWRKVRLLEAQAKLPKPEPPPQSNRELFDEINSVYQTNCQIIRQSLMDETTKQAALDEEMDAYEHRIKQLLR